MFKAISLIDIIFNSFIFLIIYIYITYIINDNNDKIRGNSRLCI